jgi:sRNA-binding carbon storage regulator CsrA
LLRLKRKLGEGVRLAQSVDLTVIRLGTVDLTVLLHPIGVQHGTEFVVSRDAPLVIHVGRSNVEVTLTKIDRGEADLGFEAPRAVEIQRAERLGPP